MSVTIISPCASQLTVWRRCRRVESKYTCPRCNVTYCSLDCFRDEVRDKHSSVADGQTHRQCSEPFYRTTVLDQIAADPKAGIEEKKKMMDMLRRFEDEQLEGGETFTTLDRHQEEEDELLEKLEGVDLGGYRSGSRKVEQRLTGGSDGMDSSALFQVLPQAHRDRFLAAMRNPESDEAKQLLKMATEEGGHDEEAKLSLALPWWKASDLKPDSDGVVYAASPAMVDHTVLCTISPPPGTGLKLAYNAIAIW